MAEPAHRPVIQSGDRIIEQTRPDGGRCRAKIHADDEQCAECLMAEGRHCPHAFEFGYSVFCRLPAQRQGAGGGAAG